MSDLSTRYTDNDDRWCVNLVRGVNSDKVVDVDVRLYPITNRTFLTEADLKEMSQGVIDYKLKYGLK